MIDEPIDPVYVALVEVTPLNGCWLSPSDYGGAAVRCYVATETEENAVEQIIAILEENLFEVLNIDWCVNEAEVEWENPDDPTGIALIAEARTSRNVVFGEFHTWPPE